VDVLSFSAIGSWSSPTSSPAKPKLKDIVIEPLWLIDSSCCLVQVEVITDVNLFDDIKVCASPGEATGGANDIWLICQHRFTIRLTYTINMYVNTTGNLSESAAPLQWWFRLARTDSHGNLET
jgi:hypothetical protein